MPALDAPRTRRSFARLDKVLDVPNLIDIQRRSFDWLVDTEGGGLRETIDDVSPIEDYTGNLAVVFEDITFDDPVATIEECREKDLTYARPLTVKVAFQNRETGEIRPPVGRSTAVTDPVPRRRDMWRRAARRDGYDYWPRPMLPGIGGSANGGASAVVKSLTRATDQVRVGPLCTARIGETQDDGCARSR